MGRLDLPAEQHFDARFADHAVERLRTLGDEPFLVTCSFIAPHDPNVVPSPYYEMFDLAKIELPANFGVREERFERDWSRRIIAGLGEAGAREFLRIYYAMVKLVDDQVGRILDALEKSGRAKNTIVVFTADHGDMAGGHGMVWKSTSAFYDDVATVPLLIRFPGRIPAGTTASFAANLTDLMPTLLGLAGRPVPDGLQGHNLAPFITGEEDASAAPQYTFSERIVRARRGSRTVPASAGGHFMVRGRGWKYVTYFKGHEYLYHLERDPGETKNLAAEPQFAERKAELRRRLLRWLKDTGYSGHV
jgi:arylsulfatase A-like enzyme